MNKKIIEILKEDAESILNKNQSFCAAPWIHTHIWPDGRVFPCCLAEYDAVLGNVNNADKFIDIWNNESYRTLRDDMLQGKLRPDICNRCYTQEKYGIDSLRLRITTNFWEDLVEQLQSTKEDFSAELKLPYWDYRFNNICNLSCRTCGPDLSSSWYNDHISRYGISPKYSQTKFTVFDPVNTNSMHNELIENQLEIVKEIYFAGGEPILMPEHLDIIQRLLETRCSEVSLKYSTNASTLSYKGFNFIEAWPKFKDVVIFVSLDELFERAEYWRNGTNWKKLETNIRALSELSKNFTHVKIGYAPTISIFNFHRLDVIIDFLIKNDLIQEDTPFSFNILQGPDYFNIKNAPEKLKNLASESLDRLEKSTSNRYTFSQSINIVKKWIAENCDSNENYFITAKNFAEIDKIRNQNLKTIAPEIYEIYKSFNYETYYDNFTPHKSIE